MTLERSNKQFQLGQEEEIEKARVHLPNVRLAFIFEETGIFLFTPLWPYFNSRRRNFPPNPHQNIT